MKQSDWNCVNCNMMIFGSKPKCLKCGAANPNKKNTIDTQHGDWNCPKCNCLVFASKNKCFKCGNDKSNSIPNIELKGGDWNCSKCGDHQFAKNLVCRMCGTKKNPVVHNIGGKLDDSVEDIDDNLIDENLCVICLTNPREYAFLHTDNTSHLALCAVCKPQVEHNKCAVCRKNVTTIIRVFNP